MFDIIGFWAAVTLFCLPPLLVAAICVSALIDSRIRKESDYELRFEWYYKVTRGLDMDAVTGISLTCCIPMLLLGFDFMLRNKDISFINHLANCSVWWTPFTAWVAMAVFVMALVMLAVKMYVKFVLLANRVSKLTPRK